MDTLTRAAENDIVSHVYFGYTVVNGKPPVLPYRSPGALDPQEGRSRLPSVIGGIIGLLATAIGLCWIMVELTPQFESYEQIPFMGWVCLSSPVTLGAGVAVGALLGRIWGQRRKRPE